LTIGGQRILSWGGDGLRLWDAATGQQIGPTIPHPQVRGALLTKDERRILSWAADDLHLWDINWPSGNLLEVACALLPDKDLGAVAKRYGIVLPDPICGAVAQPNWSMIEPAPSE
jgi:hypothetical protein